jgi:hypothetical protein
MLSVGGTTVMNVTGAVVIDLLPPTPETLATRHRRLKMLATKQKTNSPKGSPGQL